MAFPLPLIFPEASVYACKVSPVTWLAMQLRQFFQYKENLTIQQVSLLSKSFAFRPETAAVVCYLHSEALEKMRPKLKRYFKAGTLFISTSSKFSAGNLNRCMNWKPLFALIFMFIGYLKTRSLNVDQPVFKF